MENQIVVYELGLGHFGVDIATGQSIQCDLNRLALHNCSHSPVGMADHCLLIKGPDTGDQFVLAHGFKGDTADLDVLTFTPPRPCRSFNPCTSRPSATPGG
jgi:hypothetical protein